jgi:polyhydroxybutyrate depolymerase
LLLFVAALTAACGSSSSSNGSGGGDASADGSLPGTDASTDSASTTPDAGFDASAIVAARPYTIHVPTGYDKTKPTPLVVMFHSYGVSGGVEEAYERITPTSDAHGFLYAYGEGLQDMTGAQYWNATDACCDLDHAGTNDVQYFDAIVADITSKYNVDPKRIYVMGHSNGGFMSHRLACDRAHVVAAIFSLAGDTFLDPSKCNPSEKVPVVELHGDADQTILYDGGTNSEGTYPSAHATVATWAQKNGCTGALAATGTTVDVDALIAGNETKVEAYASCPAGIDVQLWTIQGGAHIPSLNHPGYGELVWGFLSAHAKP